MAGAARGAQEGARATRERVKRFNGPAARSRRREGRGKRRGPAGRRGRALARYAPWMQWNLFPEGASRGPRARGAMGILGGVYFSRFYNQNDIF